MKIGITSSEIEKLPTTGKRYDVRFNNAACRGLLIRVSANGNKIWNFWQRIPSTNKVYRASFGPVIFLLNDRIDKSNINDAIAWAAKQRKAVAKGQNKTRIRSLTNGPIRMEQLFTNYFEDHALLKKRVSSQKDDIRIFENHIRPVFENVKVKQISHTDVDVFYSQKLAELQKLGGSGGRANNILALLSKMMSFAVKRGYIKSNPCVGIEKIRTEHDWTEISNEQREKLRSIATQDDMMTSLIIDFALKLGARKQEILKARWEEFDGDKWTIPSRRKKDGKLHALTVPPILISQLNEWRARPAIIDDHGTQSHMVRAIGFVFPSNARTYFGRFDHNLDQRVNVTPEIDRPPLSDLKSCWNRVRVKAGLPDLRFHDLRHDFGTQSAKAGMTLFELMDAMGHSNASTTLLYINKAGLNGQKTVVEAREKAIEEYARAPNGKKN